VLMIPMLYVVFQWLRERARFGGLRQAIPGSTAVEETPTPGRPAPAE
jgi:hypothetical protein